MGLGIGRAFKKVTGGGLGGLLGGVTGGLLGGLFGKFSNPSVERMSAAERKALEEQKVAEDARKRRLLEGQQRRTRVALGSVGGARSLLFGGMTGTEKPVIDQPLDTSINLAPAARAAGVSGGIPRRARRKALLEGEPTSSAVIA